MTRSKLILLTGSLLLVLFFLMLFIVDILSNAKPWITSVSDDIIQKNERALDDSTQQEAVVVRVIDGDTIEIEDGSVVRYIGIDTPETEHPQKGVECFGQEASNYNTSLVLGNRVRMEVDTSETDRYGRLLRYVYVQNEEDPGAWVLVNEKLVKEGYAYSVAYPPDTSYQHILDQAQSEAQEAKKGVWDACPHARTTPIAGILTLVNIF